MSLEHPTRLLPALALVVAGTAAHAENLTPKLQLNGFGTAGFTSVTDDYGGRYLGDPFDPEVGIDNDGNFSHDNVLGIQLKYQVDERVDLVGQLVSVGREDYDTRAEWAYAAYRVNNNLRLRAGRFALPTFMFSENTRVGQAWPWARLPVEVYLSPFNSADAVDVLYRVPLGEWDLNAQAFQSRADFSNALSSADVKNLHGVNATLSRGGFSVRGSYTEGKLDLTFSPFVVPAPPTATGADLSFASLGTVFDDGEWFAAAEAVQLRVDGYIADVDAAYASVGHYVGKWLPYVLVSKSNAVNGDECRTHPYFAAFGPFADAACRAQEKEQTSYALGVRHDLSKQTSVKLQVDHVTDFHGTPGFFAGLPAPGTLSDDDDTQVVTININTAF